MKENNTTIKENAPVIKENAVIVNCPISPLAKVVLLHSLHEKKTMEGRKLRIVRPRRGRIFIALS